MANVTQVSMWPMGLLFSTYLGLKKIFKNLAIFQYLVLPSGLVSSHVNLRNDAGRNQMAKATWGPKYDKLKSLCSSTLNEVSFTKIDVHF